MAAKDIEKYKWKKGQSGNPKGRPKRTFNVLNDELKKEGYDPLSRGQLVELYSLLFQLPEEKIKEMATRKDNPLAVRLAIQDLTDPATRTKALQDYRNYAFGGAPQILDHQSKGESISEIFKGLDLDIPPAPPEEKNA